MTCQVEAGPSYLKMVGGVANAAQFKRAFPLAEFRRQKGGPGSWQLPFTDAEALTEWVAAQGGQVSPEVVRFGESLWSRQLTATARSTATKAHSRPPITGLTGIPLPVQDVVLAAAAEAWVQHPKHEDPTGKTHRALLVADEPGLGKTLSGLGSVRITGLEAKKTLVVCPTSLTRNWASEMGAFFATDVFTPWIAQTKSPHLVPEGVDTVIIGWEIVADWADELLAWGPDAILADEGHYAKSGKQQHKTENLPKVEDGQIVRNPDGTAVMEKVTSVVSGSARATAVLKLGRAVAKCHGLVMALTGTPIVNRPLELQPLLEFVGLQALFGGGMGYKKRYCGPKKQSIGGRTITSYTGASNLLELNGRLAASGHYVRRTKQTLIDAGALKAKYVDRVFTYDRVTPPRPWTIRCTPEEWAVYEQSVQEQRAFFLGRATEIAQDMNTSIDAAKVREKVASEGAKHLTEIGKMRKAAAEVKVPYIIRQVEQLVDRGEKVVVAAHHKDVVKAYAAAFTGLRIQGEMGVPAVEETKRLFNETPASEHPVLVLSVEAGKTGHTLCKQMLHGAGPSCAYMIFAEQVWTPGDEAQAQDRIWRIGQEREVFISNALLAGSIDVKIFKQRLDKRVVVNTALDAVDPETLGKDTAKAAAGEIAQELVYGTAFPTTRNRDRHMTRAR